MLRDLNRRSFLLGSAAALAGSAAPFAVRASGAAPVKLTVGRRTIEVQGRAAPAFGITQPDGTSGLTLEHDDRFLVDLVNDAGEDTIIHWHGQLPPFLQDGFPDKDRPLIPQGGRKAELRFCADAGHPLDALAPGAAGAKANERAADRADGGG